LGGMEARDGTHLLVADAAEPLAEQVVRLMKNPDLAGRLAVNARRLIEERYTWDHMVELLESVYQQAVGRARPAANLLSKDQPLATET